MSPRKYFIRIHRSQKVLKALQSTDLISPGLWKIGEQYFSIFGRISILPWEFVVPSKQLNLLKNSPLRGTILKFSPLLPIAYTLMTFVLLTKKLLLRETRADDTYDIFRTFLMFYMCCVYPAIIPTSCILGFRAGFIAAIINPITTLEASVSGM